MPTRVTARLAMGRDGIENPCHGREDLDAERPGPVDHQA